MEKKGTEIPQIKVQETPTNCPVPPPCPVCPQKPKFSQVCLKALLVLGVGLVLALIILVGSGLRITRKESLLDIWLASRKGISPTPEISQPTPTPDPTAGWKTVSDGQVGVTFKYPDNLFPFTNKPIVSPDLAQFNFEAFSNQDKRDHRTLTEADLQLELFVFNPAKGSLEPYLSAIKTLNNAIITQPFPGITGSYIKVKTLEEGGTQTAVFYAEPEREYSEYDAIVMGANNKVATIRLMTGSHNKREQLLPMLDQILSTFKFLDQDSSQAETMENWKTYTNSLFAFEIKYPSEWTIRVPSLEGKHEDNKTVLQVDLSNSKDFKNAAVVGGDKMDFLSVSLKVWNRGNKDLNLALREWDDFRQNQNENVVLEKLIDKAPFIRRELKNAEGTAIVEYVAEKGRYLYILTITPQESSLIGVSDQILSTFKFLE